MREPVSVDSEALESAEALPQGAFDGGTGLSFVENDRLIVDDAPLIQHVGIGANGECPASRIDTAHPEPARGIQAHHIG